MNKSINTVLEGIRERLDAPAKTEQTTQPPVAEGKFAVLVGKLKKRGDVKDPAALAAWIGRKKYGKERFAKMSQKESVDVESLLVFEDIEDVLAFVEGLEALTAEPVDEAKKKCMAQGPGDRRCELSFGHKGPHKMGKDTWESAEVDEPVVAEGKLDVQALGDYRRSNPKEAVAAFKRLKAAAMAWKDQLDSAAAAHTERQRVFLFALQAIRQAVGPDKLRSIAPYAMAVADDIKDGVADPAMRKGLGALINSEEIRLGVSPVVR